MSRALRCRMYESPSHVERAAETDDDPRLVVGDIVQDALAGQRGAACYDGDEVHYDKKDCKGPKEGCSD